MTLYTSDLYEEVIGKNAPKVNSLRVISGYSSAQFVETVLKQFPHLYLQLYIGMSHQGISYQDHENYKRLKSETNRLNVYYQISGQPNHMKILDFESPIDSITYGGSANFTNNGFFFQQEMLMLITKNVEKLFEYQHLLSLCCTDKEIDKHITFYQKENPVLVDLPHTMQDSIELDIGEKWRELRKKIDINYYDKFHVEILSTQDNSWKHKTINSWTVVKEPVLSYTPRLILDEKFPTNKEVEIYTDDGKMFKGELTGDFNKYLRFRGTNIYEYVKERINLTQQRPIHYIDLENYGCTRFYFERITETIYLMNFSKELL